MAYIAPVHAATSIRHAIKLRLLDPDEDCLVVAKANRLEVYTLASEGLTLQHTAAVWGRPVALEKLVFNRATAPSAQSDTRDQLFVFTDRQLYFTLRWDDAAKQLRTERRFEDLSDPSSRLSQSDDRCNVDPFRRYMTLEAYEGLVTVIPIITEKEASRKRKHAAFQAGSEELDGGSSVTASRPLRAGDIGEPVPCRIEEILVRSSAFLHSAEPREPPRLALLYEDSKANMRLKVRELKIVEGDVEMRALDVFNFPLEVGSKLLIPVPGPINGVLVLGESTVRYLNDRTLEDISQSLPEATVFVCWEAIDNRRWVLADDYCRLYFLMLDVDQHGAVTGWKLEMLGTTSHAETLVYLGNGVVFVGSHSGDSQVVRILDGSLEVMQTLVNIAPVLDFEYLGLAAQRTSPGIDDYTSGCARIITASGAFDDGSIRSVCSGVAFTELGVLGEMDLAEGLWGVRMNATTPLNKVDTLVVSFVDGTRVFGFASDGSVEEQATFGPCDLSRCTLLTARLPNDRLLRVSDLAVNIWSTATGAQGLKVEFARQEVITTAASNDRYVVVVSRGRELIAYDIRHDAIKTTSRCVFSEGEEVSGVSLSAALPHICMVALPLKAELRMIDLRSGNTVRIVTVGTPEEDVPRSVAVVRLFSAGPLTVLVAMADGSILCYDCNSADLALTLVDRTALSAEPATLTMLQRGDGIDAVYASCDRPSLIYGAESRHVYAAVDITPNARLCPFSCEAFDGATAVATPDKVLLAQINLDSTTQVRSLPVGETVYRLAHLPDEHLLGIGTIKRELRNSVEHVTSRFILADDMCGRQLSSYALDPNELFSCVISLKIPDGRDEHNCDTFRQTFVVGTSFADVANTESAGGRIIIFEITKQRGLDELLSRPLPGACRALGVIEDKGLNLVAALNKSVAVYDLNLDRFGDTRLIRRATYRTSTAPTDIAVTDDLIAVSDLMKSVSILHYQSSRHLGERDSLIEVARHYQTVWSTCVTHVGGSAWLEGDAEGNLVLLQYVELTVNGNASDVEPRMVVAGELHLGEMVNRMKPLHVCDDQAAVIQPRGLLATVDGGVYLYGLLNPKYTELLLRLQASLSTLVTTPGQIPFLRYRGFKNRERAAEEPFRFVDGAMLLEFLKLPRDVQERVVNAANEAARLAQADTLDLNELTALIENLGRMR